MAKIEVELDEQQVSNLHILVTGFRKQVTDDPTLDASLRDTELALAGALRSHGWTPKPEGGWVQHGRIPGRRF